MSIEMASGKGRIWVIDVARFYAMALVFYGHFIERFMLLKNPAGFAQYKFIYSFHMVVFFVLAGYVAKESDTEFRFGKYLKHRFVSRLLPFIFFTAIWVLDTLGDSGLTVFWVGCLMTFASLGVCIPLIYVFNRCFNQLFSIHKYLHLD